MGNKGLITTADWPSVVDFPLDEEAEVSELLVPKVIEDARNLLKIIKERKTRLTIYVVVRHGLRVTSSSPCGHREGRVGQQGRGHQEVCLLRDKAGEGDQAPATNSARSWSARLVLSRGDGRVRGPGERRALHLERDQGSRSGSSRPARRRSRTRPTRRRTRFPSSPHSI